MIDGYSTMIYDGLCAKFAPSSLQRKKSFLIMVMGDVVLNENTTDNKRSIYEWVKERVVTYKRLGGGIV
jgi:hypothetical protein